MNSQEYDKEELYPEDFSEDDKLEFDIFLEQSKMLFPKLANDDWLIRYFSIYAGKKIGDTEPPSQEEIANIRNQYTKDTIFYTEAVEITE